MILRSAFWGGLVLCLFLAVECPAESLYETLGVPSTATLAEIKSAHRKLALKYHPDRNAGNPNAEAKFKDMQVAYDILKDPVKRSFYDRTGRTDGGSYQAGSHPQKSEEELRQDQEKKDLAWAEDFGPRVSNDRWTYDPVSHRIYDSRTRKWLVANSYNFRSEEGWLFHGREGEYQDVDLLARWNPDNPIGWYRWTNKQAVPIDPATGFPRMVNYAPGTVSEDSHLFEELMNPVSVVHFKANRGNRTQLLKDFENLRWTDSQVMDFTARAKAHTTILSRPDMKVASAGDQVYFNSAMEAILDYEEVRLRPEIVVDFLRRAIAYRIEIPKALLMKDEWLNHKNAAVWLSELFRYREGAEAYIEAALAGDSSKGHEAALRFKRAYLVLENVGMDVGTVDLLIGMLGKFGDDAYNVLAPEMSRLTSRQAFVDLIATVDPNETKNVRTFLAWYAKHDPKRARIFDQTLDMPGTKVQDFWRLTDKNQYGMDAGYSADKVRTSAARLRFMQANLSTVKCSEILEAR